MLFHCLVVALIDLKGLLIVLAPCGDTPQHQPSRMTISTGNFVLGHKLGSIGLSVALSKRGRAIEPWLCLAPLRILRNKSKSCVPGTPRVLNKGCILMLTAVFDFEINKNHLTRY